MLKRIGKILSVFVLLVVLLLGLSLWYVQHNRQKIMTAVISELRKNIRGELTVGNAELNLVKDFPRLSFQLNDISIKDSVYKKNVVGAEHIFFRLNMLSLLTGNIYINTATIENGSIYFIRDSSGYSNSNVFRTTPSNDEPGDIDLELNKLRLVNLQVLFIDINYKQNISMRAVDISGNIVKNDTALDFFLRGTMHTDSMVFLDGKGAYLRNKNAEVNMHMSFQPKIGTMKIIPSPIVMDGEEYMMEAIFTFAKQPAHMSMHLYNRNTNFEKARTILPDTIQDYMKDLQIHTRLNADVVIDGDIIPGWPPQVDAVFTMQNAKLTAYGVNMNDMDMKVSYMNYMVPNEKHDVYNSAIFIDVAKGNAEGIPFVASMAIRDLVALNAQVTFNSKAPLQAFNTFLPDNKYKFTTGTAHINMAYRGTLYYYLDTFNQNFNDTLLCTIKATNGGFTYFKRNIKLDNFNTDIVLTEEVLKVNELNGVLNGNKLSVTGAVKNIRRAIASDVGRMQGEFNLDAPNFNLSKILTENTNKDAPKAPAAAPSKGEMKKTAGAIDELTGRLDVLLHLRSNKFTFRKFEATNVKGDIGVSANGMMIKNLQLNACGGSLQVSGGLNTSAPLDVMDVSAQIKNVDMAQFMQSAEDFSQTAVTHKNLAGNLTANATFKATLNSQYQPDAQTMKAVAFFSLKNGRIINFEPMMSVGKNVFKKRDFSNVVFAEIKDSIYVNGKEIKVRRMEIASSVLRLFAMGTYTVDGPYDFLIEFPLNNLKPQDINYTPENIGTGAKTGAGIFISVKGEGAEKPKITLVPNGKKKFKEAM